VRPNLCILINITFIGGLVHKPAPHWTKHSVQDRGSQHSVLKPNQSTGTLHIDSDTIQNICNAQPVCVFEQNQAVASNHQSFLVQVPGYRTA
jgi:hypothetical protein